jgi:hypothetical protein
VPFTPSHAVVAIPLRRLGLPLGAVAVGAMSPDTAVFLPRLFDYGHTHSLQGVVTTDLAVGWCVVVVWWLWVRAPVVDVMPDGVRRRLRLEQPRWHSVRWWVAVVVGVALGALTHIVWDGFTHTAAWGADLVPALRDPVGPLPLTSWLQYASGLGGLVGIALWWRAVQLRRSPDDSAPRAGRLRGPLRLLPVGGTALGMLLGVAWVSVSSDAQPTRVLVTAVKFGGLGGLAGVLALTLVWHLVVLAGGPDARSRSGTPAPRSVTEPVAARPDPRPVPDPVPGPVPRRGLRRGR